MQTLFDGLFGGGAEQLPNGKKAETNAQTAVPAEKVMPTLSVSAFIEALNDILGEFHARVAGEVTSAKRGPTGHWYFNLKDPEDGATLNCVIWRSNYALSGVELADGLAVVVTGTPDVYAPNGRLSFKADTIELVGEGALRAAYLKLKEKLATEGLFDDARKRSLPAFPRRIGVITSTKSGTVIHDFTNNLGKHGFKISVCDARVEGAEAVRDLLAAIRTMRKRPLDALVVIRGGGSFESLAPFDNEAIVREIAACKMPVIAGIGHHEDVTLATLVADLGVSTPTAAANLLNQAWDEAERMVVNAERSIIGVFGERLRGADMAARAATDILRGAYGRIESRALRIERRILDGKARVERGIALAHARLGEATHIVMRAFPRAQRAVGEQLHAAASSTADRFVFAMHRTLTDLGKLERAIADNDPARQLRLGWSITRSGGKVVRSVREAPVGAKLEVQVVDGSIVSIVNETKPD